MVSSLQMKMSSIMIRRKHLILEFFATYYREMAEQGYFYHHLNLKAYSFQLNIVMKILKKHYKQLKMLFQNYNHGFKL